MNRPGLIGFWVTIGVLSSAFPVSAQNPEAGRIDRFGDQAILVVDAPRPVDSAAITLAQEFGIAVSVEDPPYIFRDDITEVTEISGAVPPRRLFVPRGGRLEIRFSTNSDGSPQDVAK